jgi:hypothetical protein
MTPYKAPQSKKGKGQGETDLGPLLRLFTESATAGCNDIDLYARLSHPVSLWLRPDTAPKRHSQTYYQPLPFGVKQCH